MAEKNARRTFARFLPPAVLMIIGLVGMQLPIAAELGSAHEVTTISFGLFTVGAFAFVIIINHARNQLINDTEIVEIAQILVIYGGLVTVALYEQFFILPTLALTVCAILAIGTLTAIVTDMTGIERADITSA